MRTSSSEPQRGSSPDINYVLEGSVLEARAEARLDGSDTDGRGLAVAAWQIRQGHINGVEVSRQILLVVSTPAARLILVDERATPEQVLALLDAFSEKLGGPLAGRVRPRAKEMGFSQVPITYRRDGNRGMVFIPRRFRLAFELDPAGGAQASEIWINVPEHDLVSSGNELAATYRDFYLVGPHHQIGRPLSKEEAR